MALHPHLASMPLKPKALAKGKRVPRTSSIVGWFCRLPSLECAVGSVAPGGCHLALVSGRASFGVKHGGAQSDSRLATPADGRAGEEATELWPRCGERAQSPHVGRSDLPA